LRERLFDPLGITTGGFGQPRAVEKTEQAWGHSQILGKPIAPGSPAAELPLCIGPAGLAHMTITDWAKFIALHLRGDPANPHCQPALLNLDTFAEMHAATPATTYFKGGWGLRAMTFLTTGETAPAVTYNAGWFVTQSTWAKGARPADTGRRLWHAGSNAMWTSAVTIAPEINFAVLIACNRGPDIPSWKMGKVLEALIRAYATPP
jgi:CubicO group peptidase (beta-lactamase class C family)